MKKKWDISDILQRWVAPIMAILGWLLLIIFYIMMIAKPPPLQIVNIQVTPREVQTGATASIRVFTTGGGKGVQYIWDAARGKIQQSPHPEPQVTYIAPALPGRDIITVIVCKDEGGEDRDFVSVTIKERGKK